MLVVTNVYYNKIIFQQNNKLQAIHDFFFRIFDTAPVFEVTMKTYITFLHCKVELFSWATALLYTSNGEDLGVSLTSCGANGDVICYIRVRHGTCSIVDRRQAFKFCSRSPGAFILKCIPWHAIHHFVWDTHQGWSFRLEASDCSKCHFGFKIA